MALRNEIIKSSRMFGMRRTFHGKINIALKHNAKFADIFHLIQEAFLFFCSNSRSVSTTSVFNTVPYWRRKHGLPAQGKEYGPITDLPDWSYADGRPAPLKESHKMRKKLQIEYCEKIIKLTKEVDECFELNKEKEDLERQKRQNVIQNRLKQKGKVFM